MRFSGRNQIGLAVGVTVALLVIFQRPIRTLLEAAHVVEERYGLAIVPGLVILGVVVLVHVLSRRADAQVRAAIDRVTAHEHEKRIAELDRLIALGRGLTTARTMDGLREALRRHPPDLGEAGALWALIRSGGKWEAVAGGLPGSAPRASPVLEALADRVLQLGPEAIENPGGTESEGHVCFPMVVGDAAVGVLGVRRTDALGVDQRRLMASFANILSVAARNVQLQQELEEHGVYDGLTSCFNRTHGMKVLDAELQRARRAQTPLALVMFDLDYFKSVNDRYGHLCGDALLAAVGKRMRELLRNSDIKCRYGGEEFLVLLPDTPHDGATHVAESLRRELGKTSVIWNGESVSTTVSIGLALATTGELDARALIGRADVALYRAKNEGRNRVCVEAGADGVKSGGRPSGRGTGANVESFPGRQGQRRRSSEGSGPDRTS